MKRSSSAFAPEFLALTRIGLRASDEAPLDRAERILRHDPDVQAGVATETRERLAAEARAATAEARAMAAEHARVEAEHARLAAEQEAQLYRGNLGKVLADDGPSVAVRHPGQMRTDFDLDDEGLKKATRQEEIAAAALRTRERQLALDGKAVALEVARVGIERARAEVQVTLAEAEATRAGVKTPKASAEMTEAEIEHIRSQARIRGIEAEELFALYRDLHAKARENAPIIGDEAAQELFGLARRSIGLDDDNPFGGDPRRGGRR